MKVNKFTIYIYNLRRASRYSLREAAEGMGVSAPHLSDLELGKKNPSKRMIDLIISFYDLNDESKRLLYDAVADAMDTIPYDVIEYLKGNQEVLQNVINMMNEDNKKLGSK